MQFSDLRANWIRQWLSRWPLIVQWWNTCLATDILGYRKNDSLREEHRAWENLDMRDWLNAQRPERPLWYPWVSYLLEVSSLSGLWSEDRILQHSGEKWWWPWLKQLAVGADGRGNCESYAENSNPSPQLPVCIIQFLVDPSMACFSIAKAKPNLN